MHYQIELANKIVRGRVVGNTYVVTRRPDGFTCILSRHGTREAAQAWIDARLAAWVGGAQ